MHGIGGYGFWGRNIFPKASEGSGVTASFFAKPNLVETCGSIPSGGALEVPSRQFPFVSYSLGLTANCRLPVDNSDHKHKLNETLYVVIESG